MDIIFVFEVAIYIFQLGKSLYLSIMGLETLINLSFPTHGSYRFGKFSYEFIWIWKHAKFLEFFFLPWKIKGWYDVVKVCYNFWMQNLKKWRYMMTLFRFVSWAWKLPKQTIKGWFKFKSKTWNNGTKTKTQRLKPRIWSVQNQSTNKSSL